MSITSITIQQDNKVNGSNLMPVHSPLIFLVNVNYDSSTPDTLYVEVQDSDGDELETFSCIPYDDPLATQRQFAFVANDVVKGLMGEFDDFIQSNDTLSFVEDITKELTLKFYDPDNEDTFVTTDIVVIHGASQFGEYPNFESIYNRDDKKYFGPDGEFVYIYFYNEDENNSLTINSAVATEETAQDYEEVTFTDYNGESFTIMIQA